MTLNRPTPISRPTSLEGAVGSSTYEELLAETRRQEGLRSGKPRMVVLDGMNVGMAHGLGSFSVTGLSYAYEYFRERGNPVRIFLPRRMWGKASEEDRHSLDALQTTGILFYVQNHAYDDLFIIKYASNNEGIILSNDLYRDVLQTHPEYEEQIRRRTLRFTWADNTLMIAEDPFGRNPVYHPTLTEMLHFP